MNSRRDYTGRHHTLELKTVKTTKSKNRRIRVISTILATSLVLAIVGLSFMLSYGDENPHGTFVMPDRSSSTPQPAPGVSAKSVSYNYLDGVWKSSNDKIAMEAVVQSKIIVINWVGDGSSALYWAGTFDVMKGHNSEFDILSVGDTDRMKNALLASRNQDKTFRYKDGAFTFKLSIAGTETTVKMTR